MDVTVKQDQDTCIVSVRGRIDTISAPGFQQKMENLVDQGEKQIIIDCEELEYISSAGLRSVLLLARKARAEGGKLACCRLQTMVKKVFDISGFSQVIPVFDSVQDALHV